MCGRDIAHYPIHQNYLWSYKFDKRRKEYVINTSNGIILWTLLFILLFFREKKHEQDNNYSFTVKISKTESIYAINANTFCKNNEKKFGQHKLW